MTTIFIENARIFTGQESDGIAKGAVACEDGIITAIGTDIKKPRGGEVIDAGGNILAPGLVDMRVQSRNPGHAHKESRATLMAAAAAGGITALVCLPNTEPVLDEPETLAAYMQHNTATPAPRLYAYGAATKSLEDEAMAELGLLAEAGAVGFTNGIRPLADSLVMRRVMAYAAMLKKPVIQHAEDPGLAANGEMHEGEMSTRLGLRGIPAEAEEIMIARDISLARLTGAHYHIAHIATRRGVELVRRAKAAGLPVTCDTAPPYFMLNDLAAMDYDTRFQLSPPLRAEDDRRAIREGLADGTIDCIASDHAPQTRDDKLLPFGLAARGASALETLLPMSLALAKDGTIPLARALALITSAPADMLGLPCGRLAVGAPADMVLIDPDHAWRIRGDDFRSMSAATPFEGHATEGIALMTWVAGHVIHDHKNGGRMDKAKGAA